MRFDQGNYSCPRPKLVFFIRILQRLTFYGSYTTDTVVQLAVAKHDNITDTSDIKRYISVLNLCSP